MGGMHKCMPPCEWGLYICLCVLVGVERRERGYLCNCMYQLMFCEKTCERRRHIPTHISHPYHTQHIHITHHTSHPTHTHHTSHITPKQTKISSKSLIHPSFLHSFSCVRSLRGCSTTQPLWATSFHMSTHFLTACGVCVCGYVWICVWM